ncbi:MAG TPA: efflux RND transporter permease subunit, partial [Candidatus Binataceae bacterium]
LAFQEKAAGGRRVPYIPALHAVRVAHALGGIRKLCTLDGDHPDRPMCLLCGIAAVWARHMDNNIFTQIGFVVLAGMSVKNAIPIVEFAKQQQEHHPGMKAADAAIEAARLRLRPILMTSFAFIFGVIPLIVATGAGAEMRPALGTVVFFGMIGVTFFGVFLTPVFYTTIRRLSEHRLVPTERPVRSLPAYAAGGDRPAVAASIG